MGEETRRDSERINIENSMLESETKELGEQTIYASCKRECPVLAKAFIATQVARICIVLEECWLGSVFADCHRTPRQLHVLQELTCTLEVKRVYLQLQSQNPHRRNGKDTNKSCHSSAQFWTQTTELPFSTVLFEWAGVVVAAPRKSVELCRASSPRRQQDTEKGSERSAGVDRSSMYSVGPHAPRPPRVLTKRIDGHGLSI